jgi:4-nitrophenyl phosphatase
LTSLDFSTIQAVILDMDGVLWRDTQPIGDLPWIFEQIERMGWKVLLATNNATRTVDQFVEKLGGFGVALEPWQVVNSSQAAANYLAKQHPQGGPVYIVGEESLKQTLADAGFFHDEERALAVVAALDRQLTYRKLRLATLFIRSGVPFIGTNPDRTLPTPEGLVPGAGSVLAAIETASDQRPLIVGKPSPEMYRLAMERLGTSPQETLVVGDRLETDIIGAQELGCRAALVLSGASSADAARAWTPPPDLVLPDLTALVTLAYRGRSG